MKLTITVQRRRCPCRTRILPIIRNGNGSVFAIGLRLTRRKVLWVRL